MFFFVPPSEYVIGERDPGVYINEGIQIAQHGSLVIDDPAVRTVPTAYRRLFFPPRPDPRFDQGYDSLRFMGFFILDPAAGVVVGQFPHLYPIWVAIAYDTYGLTGARYVLGLWAVFSVLAVYFVGAALLGRPAAFAGGRAPNTTRRASMVRALSQRRGHHARPHLHRPIGVHTGTC